ncbi:polysaccharide deacetylase family protein [Streptomyces kunmingensis]|uniref:Polysaccharide deacetylase family protein n=1 Tax=Streptomyces kunmingensis TaxID=68225 RepID=A0ABU6C723_9ACTN|nr:polysaccharide deacetylase family protein [Streptomyces kunmingensis]MEB3960518.1 polysaccharide deacetylase family protein [Streptomyces kunmingensis]
MSRSSKHSGVGRRSALRFMGLGGVLTAGGVGAGVVAKDLIAPASASAADGHLSLTSGKAVEGLGVPSFAPGGRRPKYRRASWTQQFQSGHGWKADGAGTASSNLNDTTVFTRGSQATRVTTQGNGVQSSLRRTGLAPMNLTGKMIRLIFRVDDVTHLGKIVLYLGSGGLKNTFTWRVHNHAKTGANYVQSGEWVTVHLQWADVASAAGTYTLSANGEPSVKTGFTDFSFAVYDDAGGAVTYRLQAVELVPDTTSVFPKGVVSITFDDSHKSIHDLARPVMDPAGMPGTIYNIADAIGTGSFLSIAQMRSLQDSSGWEMAGHSYATSAHTASYEKLSAQQVDDDLRTLREWLVGNGFTSEHFAYPHGSFQKTTDGVPVDLLAARHFTTARSIVSETIESFAPAMPYRLKALTGVNDGSGIGGTTLAKVIGAGGPLDRCARSGDWLILCLHKLVAGTPGASTEISQAGLGTLVKEIEKRGIEVLTVQEAMEYYA